MNSPEINKFKPVLFEKLEETVSRKWKEFKGHDENSSEIKSAEISIDGKRNINLNGNIINDSAADSIINGNKSDDLKTANISQTEFVSKLFELNYQPKDKNAIQIFKKFEDAKLALITLGHKEKDAQKYIKDAILKLGTNASTEEYTQTALKKPESQANTHITNKPPENKIEEPSQVTPSSSPNPEPTVKSTSTPVDYSKYYNIENGEIIGPDPSKLKLLNTKDRRKVKQLDWNIQDIINGTVKLPDELIIIINSNEELINKYKKEIEKINSNNITEIYKLINLLK